MARKRKTEKQLIRTKWMLCVVRQRERQRKREKEKNKAIV